MISHVAASTDSFQIRAGCLSFYHIDLIGKAEKQWQPVIKKKKNLSHEPCITGFILEMAAQLGIAERNSDDDGKHTSSISTTQNSEVVHYKH